jgi:hypothetical protein
MDLEQLTKHQIILLTLLVSFVTSIATGIVTVSLMDQAPAGVTKVVNQIVEHTVEKVIPATQGAGVATTEKTVIVKDDDIVAQSIAKVQKSMIRITASGSDLLISRGVIIGSDGTAFADKAALAASGATKFDAILPSGERVTAQLKGVTATTSDLAVLTLALGTTTGWSPASLIATSKLVLGQSVIRIGGKGADTVGNGVVATLPATDTPNLIAASVSSGTPGSLLMTLFGDIIGITTGNSLISGPEYYSIAVMPVLLTVPPPSSS